MGTRSRDDPRVALRQRVCLDWQRVRRLEPEGTGQPPCGRRRAGSGSWGRVGLPVAVARERDRAPSGGLRERLRNPRHRPTDPSPSCSSTSGACRMSPAMSRISRRPSPTVRMLCVASVVVAGARLAPAISGFSRRRRHRRRRRRSRSWRRCPAIRCREIRSQGVRCRRGIRSRGGWCRSVPGPGCCSRSGRSGLASRCCCRCCPLGCSGSAPACWVRVAGRSIADRRCGRCGV